MLRDERLENGLLQLMSASSQTALASDIAHLHLRTFAFCLQQQQLLPAQTEFRCDKMGC
jgi:hypothetical protein